MRSAICEIHSTKVSFFSVDFAAKPWKTTEFPEVCGFVPVAILTDFAPSAWMLSITLTGTRDWHRAMEDVLKERALLELDTDFKKRGYININFLPMYTRTLQQIIWRNSLPSFLNSYNRTPEGLGHVLDSFRMKDNETNEKGRWRLHKHLFGILWVSSLLVRNIVVRKLCALDLCKLMTLCFLSRTCSCEPYFIILLGVPCHPGWPLQSKVASCKRALKDANK